MLLLDITTIYWVNTHNLLRVFDYKITILYHVPYLKIITWTTVHTIYLPSKKWIASTFQFLFHAWKIGKKV